MTSSYQINSLRDFFEKGEEITKKPLSDSVIAEYETLVQSAENFIKNLEVNSPERPQAEKALQTLRESFVKLQETSNANKQKIQEELRTEWETLRKSVVEITSTHSSQNEWTSQEKDFQEKNSESQEKSQAKPAEYKQEPITEKVQEELNEFQKEAFEAFKKQTLGENGEMDELSFRRGIEFLSELSTFSNIEVEKGKFDWLDTKEKEMLLKQMPAVQGIIGSIFVEQFFRAGYEFGFNADNTVIVKPKNAGQQTKARELQTQLNNQIARNPDLANSIKAGLLYNNQDLLTYLRMNATSDGKEISEDAQKPENFIKFLEGRNTDSAKAILASRNFFKDLNWEGHLHAASYVPSFSKKLSVIMRDPDARDAVQNAEQVLSNNEYYRSGVTALAGTATGYSTQEKTWEDLRNQFSSKPVSTTMEMGGKAYGEWLKALFTSPSAALGTILGVLAAFVFGGWKTGLATLMFGPIVAGIWNQAYDYRFGKESNEGNSEWVPPPSPEATRQAIADAVTNSQRDKYFRDTYGPENLKEKQEFIQSFDNFNFKALSDYVEARKRGEDAVLEGISDSQKAALQKPENEKILIQEIETLPKKVLEKIPWGPEKEILEWLGKLTLADVRNKALITPEQEEKIARDLVKKVADSNPSWEKLDADAWDQLFTTEGSASLTLWGMGLVSLPVVVYVLKWIASSRVVSPFIKLFTVPARIVKNSWDKRKTGHLDSASKEEFDELLAARDKLRREYRWMGRFTPERKVAHRKYETLKKLIAEIEAWKLKLADIDMDAFNDKGTIRNKDGRRFDRSTGTWEKPDENSSTETQQADTEQKQTDTEKKQPDAKTSNQSAENKPSNAKTPKPTAETPKPIDDLFADLLNDLPPDETPKPTAETPKPRVIEYNIDGKKIYISSKDWQHFNELRAQLASGTTLNDDLIRKIKPILAEVRLQDGTKIFNNEAQLDNIMKHYPEKEISSLDNFLKYVLRTIR